MAEIGNLILQLIGTGANGIIFAFGTLIFVIFLAYFSKVGYLEKRIDLNAEMNSKQQQATVDAFTDVLVIAHKHNKPNQIRLGILERFDEYNKFQIQEIQNNSKQLIQLKTESGFLHFLKQFLSFWKK